MTSRLGLLALLVAMGAGWGLTQPLSKIAVSTGYQALGLVFWQKVIVALLLAALTFGRGKRLPLPPRALGLYVVIAFLGTILPNSASYTAAQHLPSGVLSILISTVPMFAFPIALALGMDRFSAIRLLGLILGLVAVILLVGPEGSLPPEVALWVPLGIVAPFFYAIEGNYVARYGTGGLDPLQVLLGASVIGAVIVLPVTLASGQWIDPTRAWGGPEWALVASSAIHGLVYASYVWLVGRAGATFAAQVSYLVTPFGILWAMLILGESYSPWIWTALVLIFTGLLLVKPRDDRSTGGGRAGGGVEGEASRGQGAPAANSAIVADPGNAETARKGRA